MMAHSKKDWLAFSDRGHYEATGRGLQLAGLIHNRRFYPLNSRKAMARKDLVQQFLSGKLR